MARKKPPEPKKVEYKVGGVTFTYETQAYHPVPWDDRVRVDGLKDHVEDFGDHKLEFVKGKSKFIDPKDYQEIQTRYNRDPNLMPCISHYENMLLIQKKYAIAKKRDEELNINIQKALKEGRLRRKLPARARNARDLQRFGGDEDGIVE